MIDRDRSVRFNVDLAQGAYVRDYITGEFCQELISGWINSELAILRVLPDGFQIRLAVKVAYDEQGRELRFPVLLVESEDIP